MVVRNHQLDTFEPPALQGAEKLVVGGPKLSVSATSTARISRIPSSLTAQTMRTPWLTTRPFVLAFS